MNFDLNSDFVLASILGLAFVAIVVSIWQQHRSKSSKFNLFDLVMEGSKLSLKRCIIVTGFVLHCFVIVYWLLGKQLTDTGILGFAGIWITPYLLTVFQTPGSKPNGVPEVPGERINNGNA